MSAPLAVDVFVTAISVPLMLELDFCLFTTICEEPKEFDAGRLAADIFAE